MVLLNNEDWRNHEGMVVISGDEGRELVAAYRHGRPSPLDAASGELEELDLDEDIAAVRVPVQHPCVLISTAEPAQLCDADTVFALSQWLWAAGVALEAEIARLHEEGAD